MIYICFFNLDYYVSLLHPLGFYAFILTAAAIGALLYFQFELHYLYDHFMQFAVSAAAFSLALSIYLYVRSLKAPDEELAPGGNSGELEHAGSFLLNC